MVNRYGFGRMTIVYFSVVSRIFPEKSVENHETVAQCSRQFDQGSDQLSSS
jgi:hypothetical protein